jgi:hypothetical protein
MGGFLAHIPRDRILDVDMSVEDAVQTIITSGIAIDEPDDGEFRELADDERERLGGDVATAASAGDPDAAERSDGETETDTADGETENVGD